MKNVGSHSGFWLVLLWLSVMCAALVMGPTPLSLAELVALVQDALGIQHGAPAWQKTIFFSLRLPRVLLAAVGGGGLAIAGTVIQALFRNPMADPGILGVSGGAALGAVVALYVGSTLSLLWVSAASFVGSLGCAWIVVTLAQGRSQTSITSLLLAGVAIGSIAAALTTGVLSMALAQWEVGRQMTAWLMGGLEGRGWVHLSLSAPLILLSSLWLWFYAHSLNVLATGHERALSLGVDVHTLTRTLLVLSSLITAATVSVMGVISFVGLMIPHMTRLLVGPNHRKLLPLSFLIGSMFLVVCDLLCRTVSNFMDLRLGVITALLGGPFFVYLLIQHRNRVVTW